MCAWAGTDEWQLDAYLENETLTTQYLQSLHWTMGLMTGMADGDLPLTPGQFWFTVIMMTAGAFIFAFTVGAIGSLDEIHMKRATAMQTQVNAMQRFLSRYPIPHDLIEAIASYYSYNLRGESIGASATAAHLLGDLPTALRCEAVQCLTRDALSKVPLFATAEEGFMIALTQEMSAAMACPGEELIVFNSVSDSMYVVLRGSLEVIVGGEVMSILSKGSCFGEQSLLHSTPSVAAIVAISYCELYQLQREAFEGLKKEFEKTFLGFAQAAKLQAKQFKKQQAKQMKKAAAPAAEAAAPSLTGGAKEPGELQRQRTLPARQMRKQETAQVRGLVQPWSRPRAAWGALLLVALNYEALVLPVKLVFVGDQLQATLVVLDIVCDVVLFCDVWVRFRFAILDDGRLLTDRKLLRERYFKLGFIPHLLGSLPLSPLLIAWPACDARALQMPRISRTARLLWWLRASHADAIIERQQPSNLEELLRQMRSNPFDLQVSFPLQRSSPSLKPDRPGTIVDAHAGTLTCSACSYTVMSRDYSWLPCMVTVRLVTPPASPIRLPWPRALRCLCVLVMRTLPGA